MMTSAARSLLLLALQLLSTSWSQSNKCYSPNLQCVPWQARGFRDCTCGSQVLDYECHCQNDYTYFEPTLHQDVIYCDYQCLNGKTIEFAPGSYYCRCNKGFYGRCCERETPLCGGYMREPTGIISTPKFGTGLAYPNNRECVWKISTDIGKRIALGVKGGSFSVQEGSDLNTCDRDFVSVYDGEDRTSKRIGPFCGNSSRPFQTIHSTGRHLYIRFKTDAQVGYEGFQLEYITYRRGLRCGPRSQFSLPTAIIVSPQYPLAHGLNESCEYEITVMPQHQLILTTLHMNLHSSANCSQEDDAVIKVFRKTTPTEDYRRISYFCGKENYAPYTVRNATQVMLKFSSGYVEGQFKLRYEQVPENDYLL